MIKTLIQYGLICALSILAFDLATYVTGIKGKYFPTIQGRELYPDGYFKRNSILGHDIVPNHPAIEFDWRDQKAMIFANQFGCFDKNKGYESPVIYVSGDSVAWGYASYQKKYAYLIERELGITVAKCGVTHSGQRHQLIKLKSWIKQTGVKPELILLTWVGNDPLNDFLFPQATVLRGKFVDQATIAHENSLPQRKTIPEIDDRLRKFEKTHKAEAVKNDFFNSSPLSHLKDYSTSANIVLRSWKNFKSSNSADVLRHLGNTFLGKPSLSERYKNTLREANYQALEAFIDYTQSQNIPIVFLTYSVNQNATADAYNFLKSNNQYVIDYPSYLKEHGITREPVKWPINGHPNNRGNAIIARIFIDAIKDKHLLPKQ